jgi:hypothetical protein
MTAGERRAFEAGFAYGSRAVFYAMDEPLVEVIMTFVRAFDLWIATAEEGMQAEGARAAMHGLGERALAAFAEGQRVCECGAVQSLAVFELEQAMR